MKVDENWFDDELRIVVLCAPTKRSLGSAVWPKHVGGPRQHGCAQALTRVRPQCVPIKPPVYSAMLPVSHPLACVTLSRWQERATQPEHSLPASMDANNRCATIRPQMPTNRGILSGKCRPVRPGESPIQDRRTPSRPMRSLRLAWRPAQKRRRTNFSAWTFGYWRRRGIFRAETRPGFR